MRDALPWIRSSRKVNLLTIDVVLLFEPQRLQINGTSVPSESAVLAESLKTLLSFLRATAAVTEQNQGLVSMDTRIESRSRSAADAYHLLCSQYKEACLRLMRSEHADLLLPGDWSMLDSSVFTSDEYSAELK